MATIQQKIALVGADDVKKAIADIVNSGQTGFDALQKAINAVEAKQFDAELKKASTSASDFFKTILNARSLITGSVFGGLAAGFLGIVKSVNDSTLSIVRSARAAGLAIDTYQALAKATKDVGGSQDQLDGALRKFSQQTETQGKEQFKSLIDAVKTLITANGGLSQSVVRSVDDMEKARSAAKELAPAFNALLKSTDPKNLGLETVDATAFRLEGLLLGTTKDIDGASVALRKFFAEMGHPVPGLTTFEKLDQLLQASKGDFASLGISLIDAQGNLKKPEQALLEFIDAVKKIKDHAEQAQRIIKVFGKTVGPDLAEAIRTFDEAAEKSILRKQGLLVTTEDEKSARSFSIALNDLSDSWDRFGRSVTRALGPIATGSLKGLTIILDQLRETFALTNFKGLFSSLSEIDFGPIIASFQTATQQIGNAFSSMFDGITSAATNAWNSIVSGVNNLVATIRGIIDSVVTPLKQAFQSLFPSAPSTLGVDGFASGGLIRGRPGIDTNLAWLTHGEYVIPRNVVGKFGLSFFDALRTGNLLLDNLRGFNRGGLVENMTAPFAIPAFAGGGMNLTPAAARSSGRPVTVVLDGRKFAMSAPDSVADNFLRFARKRNHASAGRSPSRVR